ncbi:cyclic nucleotide-binding domain-containing protein [Pseudomonadota bacterium]
MQIFDFLTDATVVFFIANTLYVISYMLTSMLWLRILAIIAAISTFPYFYFQVEPLWSALFWQSCFLAVNLVNLLILLYSMRSASFDGNESLAYDIKFSGLKPYEVRPIFKYAKQERVEDGHILLKDGQKNQTLFLILDGECRVLKNGIEVAVLGQGHFVGELSFLSDDAVSADVVTVGNANLMSWDKHALAPLFKRQGLYESYFYSLCSLDVAGKLRAMTAGHATG